MSRDSIIKFFQKAELYSLYIIFFFLPFLKIPKNIGMSTFILSAVAWRVLSPKVKIRKPDYFEIILCLMVLVALISTLINWPIDKGVNGLKDTINFICIAFFLHNNFYSDQNKRFLIKLLISGTVIGLLWGGTLWILGQNHLFEFRRMMVAETSIITGLVTAASIGFLSDTKMRLGTINVILLSLISAFFICCMILMGNRSGIVGFIAFLSFLIFSKKKFLKPVGILSIILIIMFPSVYLVSNDKIKKRITHLFTTRVSMKGLSGNDKFRIDNWNLAIANIKTGDSLFFGVGPRNFKSIKTTSLPNYKQLSSIKFTKAPHAHNALLTKACEEGIFGLSVLLLFYLYISNSLFKLKKELKKQIDIYWILGLAALIVPFIAGMFYAPFRREVAWVSMLFFGLVTNELKNLTLRD